MTTEAEALVRLRSLVSSSTPPVLVDPDELVLLLGVAALVDSAQATPAETEWAGETAYVLGDTVVPTLRTGLRYVVSVAGTTGSAEPSWPSSGSVADGTVTWDLDTATPAAWQPTYDLAAAAAEGWRYKAGVVSDRFRFSSDGESYDRGAIFEHCLRMAEIYDGKRGELIVGDVGDRSGGAFELAMKRSDTVLGLDEDRLIRLQRWTGSGEIPAINVGSVVDE